ncbi:Hypothetical_protein [Hexamita inflata]|uniref:Hypothetical_protein n=1 Tax=Hexamita inflata TaxID=28002 RepID=A0AA86QW20_9EUKA|nr:Hypothetical protein HINF_LOCUS52858 [Hexamita inflata]
MKNNISLKSQTIYTVVSNFKNGLIKEQTLQLLIQEEPEKILKTNDLKQIVASVRAEKTVKETAHEINVVYQQQAHPEFTPDQIQEAANTEPHVSPTTVYNALKDKELMDLIGESTMSYVRSVDRVANANSPENQIARLENILDYESKVRVFVESHWTLGGLRQYGWVETGHKRLNNFNEVNYSITALSAIVETGVAYTEIAFGNITANIFSRHLCVTQSLGQKMLLMMLIAFSIWIMHPFIKIELNQL